MKLDPEARAHFSSFNQAWRSLSQSSLIPFALLAVGVTSNIIYAHVPLVAFAAMSGVILQKRKAIAIAATIWSINQLIGFAIRGYPLSGVAFTWGALMGVGTLGVAFFASQKPTFSQNTWVGHLLWNAIALIGGFVLYQGLILFAYPVLGDGHFMDSAIVLRLFVKQMTWGGAIALGYNVLLWRIQSVTLSKTHQ
ncbi:hypothetical protein [Roseofilum casamattae]|uniref:Uncharacterized protein n=1 Tax=Roseofilum casamattae BLCC-M143 TaxID=3022442 RepID=A0ABT7BSE9_9CYAN|nr:hypothetical protein [Roseofilum casamattae]MDJ1182109.1 hypothetical protein [Roseofilum casamattae BLCC-M143]